MRFFAAVLLLALALPLSAAQLEINWDKFSEGQTPTNFRSALAGGGAPGDWKIVMDIVPPTFAPLTDKAPVSRRAVLAQTSADATDERYPMFIYSGEEFKDFTLTTRFKIVSGAVEQMAGVVFRFQNESNFSVIRASALGRNISFYKIQNGRLIDPLKVQTDISTNIWHTLAIECRGNKIDGSLDGTNLIRAIDNRDAGTVGKIGFWTKSDAVSYFGNTLIDYRPLIPAAQSLVNDIMQQQPRILELRIYRLDENGNPKIIASNNLKEVGDAGTEYERNAIKEGKMFYGKDKGTVSVTMPYRDHNGDPMAAVRVKLEASLFETQDTAVTRATMIVKQMQQQIATANDLVQ
ncbi:MAG TPA: family 16 glycoside hydrolase [Verrucomicrobiae bacterium]|nr:family 16 glycoside hydrolase [Verrucomicrobiae bacterium]